MRGKFYYTMREADIEKTVERMFPNLKGWQTSEIVKYLYRGNLSDKEIMHLLNRLQHNLRKELTQDPVKYVWKNVKNSLILGLTKEMYFWAYDDERTQDGTE